MSRALRKSRAAELAAANLAFGHQLQPLPFDPRCAPPGVLAVWRSRRFLVQLYAPADGGQRLSVNRTAVDVDSGHWIDGISWDELMQVKRELGFGARWAVEIYPPDAAVVNVANIRHLWLLDTAPPFAWRRTADEQGEQGTLQEEA